MRCTLLFNRSYFGGIGGKCAFGAAAIVCCAAAVVSAQAPDALPSPAPVRAAAPPATATAPASTAPRPSADSLIPGNRAAFEFANTSIADMIAYVSRTWDLHIVDLAKLTDRVTVKIPGEVGGREAIELLDSTLLPMGYTLMEEVKGDPAILVLRVTPVSRDLALDMVNRPKNLIVYTENDPGKIPENDELRVQAFVLRYADLQKTREMILPVLDKQSDVVINPAIKTMFVTDTAARIHTAAALVQLLEKQAAPAGAAP